MEIFDYEKFKNLNVLSIKKIDSDNYIINRKIFSQETGQEISITKTKLNITGLIKIKEDLQKKINMVNELITDCKKING